MAREEAILHHSQAKAQEEEAKVDVAMGAVTPQVVVVEGAVAVTHQSLLVQLSYLGFQ